MPGGGNSRTGVRRLVQPFYHSGRGKVQSALAKGPGLFQEQACVAPNATYECHLRVTWTITQNMYTCGMLELISGSGAWLQPQPSPHKHVTYVDLAGLQAEPQRDVARPGKLPAGRRSPGTRQDCKAAFAESIEERTCSATDN